MQPEKTQEFLSAKFRNPSDKIDLKAIFKAAQSYTVPFIVDNTVDNTLC